MRKVINEYAEGKHIVPPVSLCDLEVMAMECALANGIAPELHNWMMVELHNAVWRQTVASIPFERRLLLLPKCLSNSAGCEGEIDELGLLCHGCGRCGIPSLQEYAERLGMLSIVAEGFTSVIELVENHVVDAVIGVSCLDSLEKAFPLLVGHAVPGLAIPLNHDGCHDTEVDTAYVMNLMNQHADDEIQLIDYQSVKDEVKGWFRPERMAELWHPDADSSTELVAFDWLTADGKRWRPYLLATVYCAVNGNTELTDEVRKAAVAVECFHKASLIHDDIQDGDTERYGRPTVNASHGDAFAINVGDFLLGLGYKLIAECPHRELVAAIADAHLRLSQGQGTELAWSAGSERNLSLSFVLNIFDKKTVPAFEVAFTLALICADKSDSPLLTALQRYSRALGIAYQLNDDIEDLHSDTVDAHRPSVIAALRSEHPEWTDCDVLAEAKRLSEEYHQQALEALRDIDNMEVKRLMFLITEQAMK